MNKDTLRQIVNVLAVLVTLTVNGLANAIPFNSITTGAVSDKFKVYFVPAGYVFAIWGVIYLFLIGFGVYQALPAQRENPRLRRIGYLFALSCVANSAWIPLWHFGFFPLTLLMMLCLLVLLVLIYLRLEIGLKKVSTLETWLVNITFSIYLGWITVATIANVTDLLTYWNWNGWGLSPKTWYVVMVAVASVIAALVSFTRGDAAYMLVIVWAFAGIAVKLGPGTKLALVAWMAAGLAVLVLVGGALFHRRRLQIQRS
jgi:hypothetical protein